MDTEHPTKLDRLMHAVAEHHPLRSQLELDLEGLRVRVESNSEEVCAGLARYFRAARVEPERYDVRIIAIEASEPELNLPFIDWERDPGKAGRKEQFADIEGGRVVRKVRTGMQFLLGSDVTLAVGACLKNQNQIINLVNTRYIAEHLSTGYLLCHAAGIAHRDAGIGLCGTSGAGKSTLALALISRGATFVSNDRLLLRRSRGGFEMCGVPKLPRVNPGTILGNEHLHPMLDAARRAALAKLPLAELWQLEEKYDVDIDGLFGPGRMRLHAPLRAFVVLTWKPGSGGEIELVRSSLGERPDLVPLIAKHPGPFHRGPIASIAGAGSVHALDPKPYLEQLEAMPVVEIRGTANFARAAEACLELLA
jgi:HprK-related kinase B